MQDKMAESKLERFTSNASTLFGELVILKYIIKLLSVTNCVEIALALVFQTHFK